ncbi:serine hydrolase [Enterococcus hulanensis]|uniref:serine hydrolase n=1 Tax=Enterococcus TaxID=1350 RepID=UPI001131834E|nr:MULTISPECIES: serine hydrolase [Enterococcus]MBO0410497.1 serine hydrolase [Enterococcus hulanensis]
MSHLSYGERCLSSIPNQIKNAWWNDGLQNWPINSGQVSIVEDELGFPNLTMDSTFSSQVNQKLELHPGHTYFLIFDVKVVKYLRGLFGVYFNGAFNNCDSGIGLRRKSKNGDYETVIINLEASKDWHQSRNMFVGSIGSANGAGQIRKLSLYDLTELYGSGNEPSAMEFYKVLPALQASEATYLTDKDIFSFLLSRKSVSNNVINGQTKKDPVKVFIDEMNKKAMALGLSQTSFKNVNGFRAKGQMTTVKDFLKLGLFATGFNELLNIWGKKKHEMIISGHNSRSLTIKTTVQNSELEQQYMLLGGKTGTVGGEILNVTALVSDESNNLYLSVIFGAKRDKDRFEAVRRIVDMAKLTDSVGKTELFNFPNAETAGIIKIPNGNPFFYTNQPIKLICEKNPEKEIEPASLVKIMTAILLLENIKDLRQVITLIPSDIIGGSGPELIAGDQVSLLDILHLLLLPSSNTAAKVIARVVGEKLQSK